VLEQAADAIVLSDEGGRVRFFNAAAEQLWGLDRREALGGLVDRLLPASILSSGADPAPRELRLNRPDGVEVWSSLSLSDVETEDGLRRMVVARDATEAVRRREQLRLLSMAVDETDRAMMILGPDRTVIYVNRAFTDQFGYQPAEVLGLAPSELLAGEGTDPVVLARLRERAWGKTGFVEEIVGHDRRRRPIALSAAINPILDEAGEVANVAVFLTDISSLKQVQALQEDVLSALASGLALPQVADFLCRRIEAIAPEVISSMVLVDEEGRLRPLAGPQLPAEFSASIDGAPIGEGRGSCGTACWRGQPVCVVDIETDPLWTDFRARARTLGLKACWSSPIKRNDGSVAGAFAFYYRDNREPSVLHERLVAACLHLCRLAIEHHETRRQIARLSQFDPLTGLPNRTKLLQDATPLCQGLLEEGRKAAFLVVNLDRFRDVNGGLGHPAGDRALIETAYRVREIAFAQPAVVSRIVGDTFVVVLPDADVARAAARAEALLAAVAQPIEIDGQLVSLTASIGISLLGEDGADPETLLKNAETAMHQAKAAGPGGHRFFSSEMNAVAADRITLGAALRAALAEGRLKLHYQPQIDLRSGALHGVEALARWTDPVLGAVSPCRFIPLAEELGLIDAIGRWSLREACRQMATWDEAGLSVPGVSVNLSPLHFNDSGLPDYVAGLLEEFRLAPARLTVEITEGVMMKGARETQATLSALQTLGVGLSMDDFGTGFSSLASLTRMPISELKLDRSFMREVATDANAQAITTAVVRIGQSLGMTVVAEGVETREQARLLLDLGCAVAQGFLFAAPASPMDFEDWLRAFQRAAA